MHALVQTIAFRGIDTIPVDVQVHIANGLPTIAIVGLADKAVAESRERVRAALSSIGLALPPKRIAVNLAPADVVEEGAHFDLPIALGLLIAMGVVRLDANADLNAEAIISRATIAEALAYRTMPFAPFGRNIRILLSNHSLAMEGLVYFVFSQMIKT